MELKLKKLKFKFVDTDEQYMGQLRKWNIRQYECLRLSSYGYRYEAISAQLGIPLGSVKSALSRARKKIELWRAEDAIKITLESVG